METSLMVTDYPEPKEEKETTLKVNCYFTTTVEVYGEDRENWERQLNDMTKNDLIFNCEKIEIEDWEEC